MRAVGVRSIALNLFVLHKRRRYMGSRTDTVLAMTAVWQ